MSDKPKPRPRERFTMLESKGPNNPPPEELATRIVEPLILERFTMLESKGPNNPIPGSENWPLVELLPDGSGRLVEEPPAQVVSLVAELRAAVDALDAPARAAALAYIAAELPARAAG